MKITKSYLKQVIKEEINKLQEQEELPAIDFEELNDGTYKISVESGGMTFSEVIDVTIANLGLYGSDLVVIEVDNEPVQNKDLEDYDMQYGEEEIQSVIVKKKFAQDQDNEDDDIIDPAVEPDPESNPYIHHSKKR